MDLRPGAIIGFMVGLLLLASLLRGVKLQAPKRGERHVLQYGRAMRITGVVGLAFWGAVAILAFNSPESKRNWSIFTTVLLGVAAVYLWLETFFVRIEFDSDFIYKFSPWRTPKQIPWTEVVDCQFAHTMTSYVIRTRNHETIRVSAYMSGIGSFLEKLQQIVDVEGNGP
jgi:hypothetical protein